MNRTTGTTTISSAEIYYEVAGEDHNHPLLLIHSALMNSKMWDEQVTAFEPFYRVIRFDQPGFGRSPMPESPVSDSDVIQGLLRSLGIAKSYVLGLSMGAEVALQFALDCPDMVDGLILIGSSLDGYEYSPQGMRNWEYFVNLVRARDFPRAIDEFIRHWVDGPVAPADESVRRRARAIMEEYSFVHFFPRQLPKTPTSSTLVSQVESDSMQDYRAPIDRLGDIQVPTLIMVGNQDQPDVIDIAGLLTMAIPDAKQVMIPGAAHIINLQHPDAFNRAVLDFMGNLH
jgi:3-oxoadipate enol-lactonase